MRFEVLDLLATNTAHMRAYEPPVLWYRGLIVFVLDPFDILPIIRQLAIGGLISQYPSLLRL